MKHYIWLSVLLAVGVVGAEDGAKAEEKVAAAEEKVAAAPAADDEAASGAISGDAGEESNSERDTSKKSKKSKKSKRKGKKGKGKKGSRSRKNKNRRKGRKGGHKVSAPSSSVLNAYMNRVQSGEMCVTSPESSMSATVSGQGGCATATCGLPTPEAMDAPAPEAIAAA